MEENSTVVVAAADELDNYPEGDEDAVDVLSSSSTLVIQP